MTRILIVLVCLISFEKIYAQIDSTNKKKNRKNSIEIGYTTAYFFDEFGFKESTPNTINLVGSLPIYYCSYKRYLIRDYFARISHFGFSRFYNYEKDVNRSLQVGELYSRMVKNYELGVGKTFKVNYKKINVINLDIGIAGNYRKGYEEIFLAYPRAFEILTDGVKYNSIGIGVFSGINFIFYERFSVGTDLNYCYFFENGKLTISDKNSELYKTYQPNRHMMNNNIKAGILF